VLLAHNPVISLALSLISFAVNGPRGCCSVAFLLLTKGRETGTCWVDIMNVKWVDYLTGKYQFGLEEERYECGAYRTYM
jgi:hypothetical protein